MSQILGLHNHISSLPRDGMIRFLDECLKSNANVVSITDHRTLSSYYYLFSQMTDEELEKYKNLKFVVGMEMTGIFPFEDRNGSKTNIVMDILSYNIDIDKYASLWEFINNNYKNDMDTREFQIKELERLKRVAKKYGFKMDYDDLQITDETPYAARIIGYALIDPRYQEHNFSDERVFTLSRELIQNPRSFYNRYCKANTPFHLDTSIYFPAIQDVIDAINNAGALPFLDHPAAYFPKSAFKEKNKTAWENSAKFVDDFYENTSGVKGLEIIHPSCMNERAWYQFLHDHAKTDGLYVSGGTDYHKNGEPITTDYNGDIIDDTRLDNFNDWATVYTVYDLRDFGKKVGEIEKVKAKRA